MAFSDSEKSYGHDGLRRSSKEDRRTVRTTKGIVPERQNEDNEPVVEENNRLKVEVLPYPITGNYGKKVALISLSYRYHSVNVMPDCSHNHRCVKVMVSSRSHGPRYVIIILSGSNSRGNCHH